MPTEPKPLPSISLLDYFAAAALTGLLAGCRRGESDGDPVDANRPLLDWGDAADEAYCYANAMMEMRHHRQKMGLNDE